MLHISFLAMAYLQTPLLGYDVKCNQALMPSWSQPRLKNSGSIFNANLIGCYEKKNLIRNQITGLYCYHTDENMSAN